MQQRNLFVLLLGGLMLCKAGLVGAGPVANDKQTDLLVKQVYSSLFSAPEKTADRKKVQQVLGRSFSHSRKILHRQQVINAARKQLKVPYRWGGTNRSGFDCSGLVQYAYKQARIKIPRTAFQQYLSSKKISRKELQPGDLIFFHTRRRSRTRVNHVGMYLGNNKFIHAPRRGRVVSIDKLNGYWRKRIVSQGRAI